jgi:mitochondrial fission protein ELM1
MTSDSLSSGKPTYVIPIAKVKNKIKVFQESLFKKRITKIFQGRLENWNYSKFNESYKVGVILRSYLKI